MAIHSTEVLKLTNDDLRVLEVLERRIDLYLTSNWAGPERPFDTEVNDLKWNVCEALKKRFHIAKWNLTFKHPVNLTLSSTFASVDGPAKPRAMPTLIYFMPLFDDAVSKPAKILKKKLKKK